MDVTAPAREAGFKLPTAVTRNVWERCVRVPEDVEDQGQSEEGRLWDVLWMASMAARKARPGESLVIFTVSVLDGQRADGSVHRAEHTLWVHVGPGDQAEPVPSLRSRTGLTVLFPEDY